MATPIPQQRKQLQGVHCDQDHYQKVIKTYYQHTDHHEALEKWTEEEFDSNVVKVLSEKFGDKLDDQPLHVLGLGSSEGYQEILQLRKLKPKFPKISTTVIEPSTERISIYQETVNQNCSDFTGIEYEWHNQTFQEYIMQYTGAQKKYHFITIIHAMYFLGDVEQAVRNLFELLEPGGIIFMVLATDDSGIGKLSLTFPDLHKAPTTPELLSTKTNQVTTSRDVKSVLSKYHMAYSQSSYTESSDITTFFSPKRNQLRPNFCWML
ncbi:carnosine N-methyltransferase 2-like [Amphiura filiformis]|uniref:carnosine N-methyltransferase 2-like n=1 Tax=Amphiura filiformis TaxID=82378 RepID=UPI003B2245AF